jgi:hypothetical protein
MGASSDDIEGLRPVDDPRAQIEELCWRAQCAFNWSHAQEARLLVGRALDLLSAESGSSPTSWWGRMCRNDAFHHLHQILGLLDLRNENRRAAKEHLAASAQVESTPILSSFGPSMLLADALLRLGEREAVLEYFEACRRFWRSGESRLEIWTAEVREGRIPTFGFNASRDRGGAPPCWELRRADVVYGRLFLRRRHGPWFVCTFEPTGNFGDIQKFLQEDFFAVADESLDLESAYDRLQALELVLHPGDGGSPVTEAVIQVDGDTAYFRY